MEVSIDLITGQWNVRGAIFILSADNPLIIGWKQHQFKVSSLEATLHCVQRLLCFFEIKEENDKRLVD